MLRLGVNIDHVATVRQARRAQAPDPVHAAVLAEMGGADGITVHLRGDRRHIQDRDVELLRRSVSTHLNVEMAATTEMVRIAQTIKPHRVTLVPERGNEVTTEGGLDVVLHSGNVEKTVRQLLDAHIDVSIFVDPDIEQIRMCHKMGAPRIEINTGKYTEAWRTGNWQPEIDKITTAARAARKIGLVVLGGHGHNYRNVDPLATITDIEELNIGHSIIARASLVGLDSAVREMIALMRYPRRVASK